MPKARAQAIAKYYVSMKKASKKGQYGPISASELRELEKLESQYKLSDMPPERPEWTHGKKKDFTDVELGETKVKPETPEERDARRWKIIEQIRGKEYVEEMKKKEAEIERKKTTKAEKEEKHGIVKPKVMDEGEQEYKHREGKKKEPPYLGNPYLSTLKKTEFKITRKDADKYPKSFVGLQDGRFKDEDTGKIYTHRQIQEFQEGIGKSKVKIDYQSNLPLSVLEYNKHPRFETGKPQSYLPKGVKPFRFTPKEFSHPKFETVDTRKRFFNRKRK
jgi:hypothetical protein